ncbi:flagellar assembly protein T N-terminal domain-containing protein [Marinobacterium mangrovicola]|uniref:Flagellar assembly T-like protein n=1 Tax=Marinobacterium mangrovicola TaxID=1476959 RepID=A0A4R1GF14_9GAMM|nr:flagellar assembly protein T N-terminal domain-containing protein [Marinobacterium mangrovicola]TCK06927.1 flagellar assembly T-like protein [Marinobacterium mangrovicola]
MLSIVRHLLVLLTLAIALPVQAIPVEAEGRALVINGDITSAREQAIADARQAASLQAAAYISTTQEIRDGVLEVDDMKIQTFGTVSNVQVLDERIENKMLIVRISAEVMENASCPSPNALSHRKRVALTLFPLSNPGQASAGSLGEIQSRLPSLLAQGLQQSSAIEPLDFSRSNLIRDAATAPTNQLPDGGLSNALHSSGEPLQAQFIISGVIRDMSMRTPVGPKEPNIFVDLYNDADYKSKRHLRNLALELFIYDGLSGQLLERKLFHTQGRWTRPREERTGFGSAVFWQQDYGQQVKALIDDTSGWLDERLRCESLATRISRTSGDQIWIEAGSTQGVKKDDSFTILRRMTFYDDQMRAYSELNDTQVTLKIETVQPGFSRGRIVGDSLSHNIQRDDIAVLR